MERKGCMNPHQNAEDFFMNFAPCCEKGWEGCRLGAARHFELVCWTRLIQSYLHTLPRWCIRFYHTQLGNWNGFGSLRQFRLKLLSLEKQKTSPISSLNAPFSLIILYRYPSEDYLPYWQWVSVRKTRIFVQRRGGAICRSRNDSPSAVSIGFILWHENWASSIAYKTTKRWRHNEWINVHWHLRFEFTT
jgi:hypothetical protein